METTQMIDNREMFDLWFKKNFHDLHEAICCGDLVAKNYKKAMFKAWCASASREGYKVVPCNPTEEMWGGLSRHLVKYMQSHDRYCPKTLGKYISRFIGFKNIPDWLNKEVPDWESDHAFATADLGVFIYKAMIRAAE